MSMRKVLKKICNVQIRELEITMHAIEVAKRQIKKGKKK